MAKRQSLSTRLRAANDRALAAERRNAQLTNVIDRMKGEYSGNEIVHAVDLGATGLAVRTARILGYVVTIVPDRNNSEKFALRAHRPE